MRGCGRVGERRGGRRLVLQVLPRVRPPSACVCGLPRGGAAGAAPPPVRAQPWHRRLCVRRSGGDHGAAVAMARARGGGRGRGRVGARRGGRRLVPRVASRVTVLLASRARAVTFLVPPPSAIDEAKCVGKQQPLSEGEKISVYCYDQTKYGSMWHHTHPDTSTRDTRQSPTKQHCDMRECQQARQQKTQKDKQWA